MKNKHTTHSEQELKRVINGILINGENNSNKILCLFNHFQYLIQSEREKVIEKVSSFDMAEEGMRHATIGELFPKLIEELAQKEESK